ncbi:MAG: GNAT family N-acetyltransferase [Bacteroidales bacterium]|nr:GNAT family N-acetyltransferase [Bacteroidales bacterium]
MKAIIEPVDRSILEKELKKFKVMRRTNNGSNLLYVVTAHDSPNVMTEIGRLREISFRVAGGGTGKELDIDFYDTMADPYKQLIVWDPKMKEILGGYRFFICSEAITDEDGNCNLATARMFKFSKKFREEYIPYMIELGRSFVQPAYQSTGRRSKGLYVLDNLWDGLGAIWLKNPQIKYFFGKVTMYTTYNREARDLILHFFEKYYPDRDHLVRPYDPVEITTDRKLLESILCGGNYDEDYKLLSQNVRARGETIPPLINAYMKLSPSMKVFGTAMNYSFGDVEETACMVALDEMYVHRIERHLKTNFRKIRR